MAATHKKTFTITVRPSATLTDQPVWVIISGDTDIGGRAQSDASDVSFWTVGGVELDWRLVSWTISGGECDAVLMILCPSILSSADHQIEIHYGGGAGTPSYSSTLSQTGLVGAWDLQSGINDWSGAGSHMTDGATLAAISDGPGGLTARQFDGADWLNRTITNFRSTDNAGALSFWSRVNGAGGGYIFATSDEGSDGAYMSWNRGTTKTSQLWSGPFQSTTTADDVYADNVWAHTVFAANGTVYTILVDGVSKTVSGTNNGKWLNDISASYPRDNLSIGRWKRTSVVGYYTGDACDFRFYSRVPSVAEVGYQVAQTNSPGTWGVEVAIGGTSYSQTISDSVGITDTTARVVEFSRIVVDSFGLLDGVTRSAAFTRSQSDPIGITDENSRQIQFSRPIFDSIGMLDSLSRAVSFLRSVSDDEGMNDDAISSLVLLISQMISDSVGLSDGIERVASYARGLNDAEGMVDDTTKISAFLRVVVDNESIADDLQKISNYLRAIADDEGMTDEALASMILLISQMISDSVGLTDGIEKATAFIRELSETEGLGDEILRASSYLRLIADDEGLADAISRATSFVRGIADEEGLGDEIDDVLSGLVTFLAAWYVVQRRNR